MWWTAFSFLIVFSVPSASHLTLQRSSLPTSAIQLSQVDRRISALSSRENIPPISIQVYDPSECQGATTEKLASLQTQGRREFQKLKSQFTETYGKCEKVSKEMLSNAVAKPALAFLRLSSVLGDSAAWVNIGIAILEFAAISTPYGAGVVLGIAIFGLLVSLANLAYQYHMKNDPEFLAKMNAMEVLLEKTCAELQRDAEEEIAKLEPLYGEEFNAATCTSRAVMTFEDIDTEFAARTQRKDLARKFNIAFPGQIDQFFTYFDRASNIVAGVFNGIGLGMALQEAGLAAFQVLYTWAGPSADTVAWLAGEKGLELFSGLKKGLEGLMSAGTSLFHGVSAMIKQRQSLASTETALTAKFAQNFLNKYTDLWKECNGVVFLVILVCDAQGRREGMTPVDARLLYRATGGGVLSDETDQVELTSNNLWAEPHHHPTPKRSIVSSMIRKVREVFAKTVLGKKDATIVDECEKPLATRCKHCVDISEERDSAKRSILSAVQEAGGGRIDKVGNKCFVYGEQA
uniref:SMODS and SLOG-associating 2TM effector domain-containing protein n=1 Tax=Chromera velia CCMP2878 TaxID=1169474 RepID=A0A0G4EZ52_9ALVE|eukprot:Cvel_14304.t1-p1 / transcript=Cvel_14304.t1 / gene=Cvel_14304 / organism=Chromera_velia_CCMP2878 / gene_product=hypothetical protein / transcript_product=hypothetical protein / location=Cvel_scaffold1011:16997-18969(+) / protein_length=517 / sequence_SO=supercontig / SO=protein_coding / is_pseudo=false